MFTRAALGMLPSPSWHRPFLRYVEGEQGGGDGGQGNEPQFPANTPVKDMTPEQQAAYHLHQSRKHENRAKAFGEWTPDKIRALEQERDQLRAAGQTDADKAVDAAREEGRAEVRAELNKVQATHALEKALAGRVPDASALLGLDVTAFVVNGKVDDAAVKAWAEDHSTEASAGAPSKKNPDLGAGRRNSVTETPGDKGRGEAARRFKKKTD